MAKIETLLGLAREAGLSIPASSARRRPMALTPGPGFEAGQYGRRLATWAPTTEAINTLVFSSGDTVRARSRDMVRKNWLANSAVDSFASEIIGTGIKPLPKHTDPAIRSAILDAWNRWIKHCDADGTSDFYGLQRIAVRELFEGGECFARFRARRADDGLSAPLQVQLLESELLPYYKTEVLPGGNAIRGGIEFDQIGRRVGYWMYREHPGDRVLFMNAMDLNKVPADQVLHVFEVKRAGQLRGIPQLTPSLVNLYELDKYDDAVLARSANSAMFMGFYVQNSPDDPIFPTSTSQITNPTLPGTNPDSESVGFNGATMPAGVTTAGMEPATMVNLRPGETVEFSNPPDVGTQYETFTGRQERGIATTANLSYDQLTGDLTKVNYSSIRAGLLKVRRKHEQIQRHTIIYQFCEPVFRRWFDAAMLAGAFNGVIDMAAYAKDPASFTACWWITPGWPWVDPAKEVDAAKERVRNGFSSRSEVVSENGRDSAEVDEEQRMDNERSDDLGLRYDSDARLTLNRGETVTTGPTGQLKPIQETETELETDVIQ